MCSTTACRLDLKRFGSPSQIVCFRWAGLDAWEVLADWVELLFRR